MIAPKVLMLLSTAVYMLSESVFSQVNGHIHQNSFELSKENTTDLDIKEAIPVITDSAIYLKHHHGQQNNGTTYLINRSHGETSGTEENAVHSQAKIMDTDQKLNRSATHGNKKLNLATYNPETTPDSTSNAVPHGQTVFDEKRKEFQNQESDEVKITNKNVSSKKYNNTTQNILEKLNMTIDKHYDNLITIANTSNGKSVDHLDHSNERPPVDTKNVSEYISGAVHYYADRKSNSSKTHTAGVAHTPNDTATKDGKVRTGHMHQHSENISSQTDATNQHLRSQTDSGETADNGTTEQADFIATQDMFEDVNKGTASQSGEFTTTGGPIRTSSENSYEISDVRSNERNLDIGTSEEIETTTNVDHGVGINISEDSYISKESPTPTETTTGHISAINRTQTSGNRNSKLASVESAYSVQLQPVMLTIQNPEFENKLQRLHTEDEVFLDQDMKVLEEKTTETNKALQGVNLSTTEGAHLITSRTTTSNGLALTETITDTSKVFSVPTTDWNNATTLLEKTIAPTTASTSVSKLSTTAQSVNSPSQQTNLNSTEKITERTPTSPGENNKTRDSAPLNDFSNQLSMVTDQANPEFTKDPTTDLKSQTLTQKGIELIIQRLKPHILSQQNFSALHQKTERKIAPGVGSTLAEVFQGLLMLVDNMTDSQREDFLAQISAIYKPFLNDEMSRMLNFSSMAQEKERPVDFVEFPNVQFEHNITENTICIQMSGNANCILLTANLLEYSTWHMADKQCTGLGGQLIQMFRTEIQEPVESFLDNLASKTLNGTSIWIDTHGEPTTEAGHPGNSSCPVYHIGKARDKRLGHADCAVQIPFVCQRIVDGCSC